MFRYFIEHAVIYLLTADTGARKTYRTVTVYKTVFLKINPQARNMYKTSKIKNI